MERNSHVQKWKISKLKEHPRQRELFGNLPRHELAAIAADMKENGLSHAVEILPDGTIIAGHQRVLAAKMLGWKEIDVVVREDLEEKGVTATLTYFISDNLFRRQLSGLDRARCIKALLELQEERTETVKMEIGLQLGISLREVNRHLLLLKAIPEVHEVFDQGRISLTNAGKVAQMPEADQLRIAERIAAGEAAKAVLEQYLRRRDDANDRVGGAFQYFVKALDRHWRLLNGRVPEIDSDWLASGVGTLERARGLIDGMIQHVKATQRKRRKKSDAA